MDHDDLIILRDKFREEFREHDFCIGEEQVERVFRELLGEPEPVREVHTGPVITSPQVRAEMDRLIPTIKNLFERDDTFYSLIKKR